MNPMTLGLANARVAPGTYQGRPKVTNSCGQSGLNQILPDLPERHRLPDLITRGQSDQM